MRFLPARLVAAHRLAVLFFGFIAAPGMAAIQLQFDADVPPPVPRLNLSIMTGDKPSGGVFTWDLSAANLYTDVQVVSVKDIGVVKNSPDVLSRDCGYSAQFDGRSLWFFGDTILKTPNADDQRFLCNSWSFNYDNEAADGVSAFLPPADVTGASISLIPLTKDETVFNLQHQGKECDHTPCDARWAIWPGTIAVDEEAMIAYVFYHKVYVASGDLNFTTVGHSIAILRNFDGAAERPEFNLYEEYPTLLFSEERDGFGSAAVEVDRLLYVYGCEL